MRALVADWPGELKQTPLSRPHGRLHKTHTKEEFYDCGGGATRDFGFT